MDFFRENFCQQNFDQGETSNLTLLDRPMNIFALLSSGKLILGCRQSEEEVHLKGSRFMEDSMTFQGESLEDLKIFQTGGIIFWGNLLQMLDVTFVSFI